MVTFSCVVAAVSFGSGPNRGAARSPRCDARMTVVARPVAQEANIIWAPAGSLAADPRRGYGSLGLTSRAWPRHQAEDALLPNHIVDLSLLDPLPVHQADRRDFNTILKTTARQVVARGRGVTRRGYEPHFTPKSENANRNISPARPDPGAGGRLERSLFRGPRSSRACRWRGRRVFWIDWHTED